MKTLRIATRQSPLALWQAQEVTRQLKTVHQDIKIELIKMVTQGDKILDSPLARIGGKSLFVKELEIGILEDRADIAVHSMKDVPIDLPEGLHLNTIIKRGDPTDAFVSNQYKALDELPDGAVIGTSSMRRQCQLKQHFPHLIVKDLRGNVNTRLSKLDAQEYDAIVVASAGLKRLGFSQRITAALTPEHSLPAIGQGAIGIECREHDETIRRLLAPLADEDTTECVRAERAMGARLQGGCQIPIGGFAVLSDDQIWVRGLIGAPDGTMILCAQARGCRGQATELGVDVAEDLLSQGAGDILTRIFDHNSVPGSDV